MERAYGNASSTVPFWKFQYLSRGVRPGACFEQSKRALASLSFLASYNFRPHKYHSEVVTFMRTCYYLIEVVEHPLWQIVGISCRLELERTSRLPGNALCRSRNRLWVR
jgi:hypothetical protein